MDSTPIASSFYSTREHSIGIGELNKKRKLPQYDTGNIGLSRQKHKGRDQSNCFSHGPMIPENLDKKNLIVELTSGDGLEVKSGNDSNSFDGGSDTKMAFEVNSDAERFLQEHPSTASPNGSSGNFSQDILYSLESRCLKEVHARQHADREHSTPQSEHRHIVEQHATSDLSSNDQPEHGKKGSGLKDETTDDMMIYSKDEPPFVIAPGRWSVGQDARLGTRKPTIDQEFEQYFSALML